MTPILFPGLGLEFNLDPVAFNLFGKDIYWYGIIIACGFLLALVFCTRQAPKLGLKTDDLLDLMFVCVPCGIVGARIYYVVFFLDLFRDADGSFNLGRAVRIWDGGLAIYGGILAAVLAAVIFCRVRKLPFWTLGDCACYGLLIGQAIGRWGNFVNQEAYGGACTALWRMGLTKGGTYVEVHPTFLYESLWNLAGLAILYFLVRPRRKFDGQLFLSYILWYGLGRAWIEGMRSDSLYFFGTGIRVSQALAILSAVGAGVVLALWLRRQKVSPKPLYVERQAAAQAAQAAQEAREAATQPEQAAQAHAGAHEAPHQGPAGETGEPHQASTQETAQPDRAPAGEPEQPDQAPTEETGEPAAPEGDGGAAKEKE